MDWQESYREYLSLGPLKQGGSCRLLSVTERGWEFHCEVDLWSLWEDNRCLNEALRFTDPSCDSGDRPHLVDGGE